MTQKVFYTARELADIAKTRGLTSFPNAESSAIRFIKRMGWDDLPCNLCRKRDGRGGGREYHVSLLPDAMQAVIHGRAIKDNEQKALTIRKETEARKVASIAVTALRFRQRNAMEARGEILTAITRYKNERGMTAYREAILMFVRAQTEHAERLAALEKADQGEALNDRERVCLERPSMLTHSDGFGLLEDTLRLANDRSGGDFWISMRTVQRWFETRATQGITALAPALTKIEEAVPAGFSDFLQFYAKPQKPAMTEAIAEFRKKYPGSPLTIEQVRYTLKHKLNDIEKNVGREGLLTLRSRLPYIQRSTENLFPTTIYTADGKTFDAEVAHPIHGKAFKPEITSMLDVATRRCVGFAVSLKENVIAVTEALRNSCCAHGIPAIFYVDRGAGYKNKAFDGDFSGLMGRLSITKMHALPYNSQAKGIIERFNGTVWNPLARSLPTYLGETMDKEAANRVHKATRQDLKAFGTSRILPSWEEFQRLCATAIVDYNSRPHRGLPRYLDTATGKYRHYSPDEFWAQHAADGFEPVPVDDDMRDDLFRPYEIRVARRGLVEWNNNRYYHAALEAHHGEEVMVGYDFAQARYVWVREIDREEGQPGRLICVADFTENKTDYVPKTYQRAAEERRLKGRLSRLDRKRADIDAEFSPPTLLDQSLDAMPIIDLYSIVPEISTPLLVVDNENPAAGTGDLPRRRTFASDAELALWAIENPHQLTSNQVRVLRSCLEKPAAIELLRMSGIDLNALRNIVRAAA